MSAATRVWTDILEEHAGEAAFLYELRGVAFHSYRQTLDTLAQLDDRLRSHLAGLEVSPADAWELAEPWLGSKSAGEAFVAGWLAVLAGGGPPLDGLLASLEAPASLDGLSGALRLATAPGAVETLHRIAAAETPGPRALALDALAFRGQEVPAASVRALLALGSPVATLAAINVATRRRHLELRAEIARSRAHEHPRVASAALQAMAMLGDPGAPAACRDTLARPDPAGAIAARLLGAIGAPGDAARLVAAARSGPHARVATLALARHGHATAGDALIAIAADPPRSRPAGHGLEILTGVELAAAHLDFPPGSDGADAAVVRDELLGLDLDDGLAAPDPAKLARWWEGFDRKPERDERVRRGAPLALEAVAEEAARAALPDRDDALLELASRLSLGHVERRGWSEALRGATAGLAREAKRQTRERRLGAWHVPGDSNS